MSALNRAVKELFLLHWNPYCVMGLESHFSFPDDESMKIIDTKIMKYMWAVLNKEREL